MLEYVAVILIAAGFFLLFQGLRESYPSNEIPDNFDVFEEDYEYGMEEFKPERKVDVKGGGVILIGPIPIVFGESRYAVIALILTIVIMVLAISFMVVR